MTRFVTRIETPRCVILIPARWRGPEDEDDEADEPENPDDAEDDDADNGEIGEDAT